MQNVISINVATINNNNNRTRNELIDSIFEKKEIQFAFIYDGTILSITAIFSPFRRRPKGTILSTKSTTAFHSDSRYISRLDHNNSLPYNLILR